MQNYDMHLHKMEIFCILNNKVFVWKDFFVFLDVKSCCLAKPNNTLEYDLHQHECKQLQLFIFVNKTPNI